MALASVAGYVLGHRGSEFWPEEGRSRDDEKMGRKR